MIKAEIEELRSELNQMINDGADFESIYCQSRRLDCLIAGYYEQNAHGGFVPSEGNRR